MLIAGYFFLGFLIGTITGITSSPITNVVITSIFTLFGGLITISLEKTTIKRNIIGGIICSFSVACLLGLFLGIFIKENKYLTSFDRQNLINKYSVSSEYLKAATLKKAKAINSQLLADDKYQCEEAYNDLWDLINESMEE